MSDSEGADAVISSSGKPDEKIPNGCNTDNKRKLRREGEKLRRERLNQRISQLAEELPWLESHDHRPDKARILKLAVNYLKLHHGIKKKRMFSALPSWLQNEVSQFSLEKVADGFLLVVSKNGSIIYVSDTITNVLGHSQLELIGSSIYKILHEDDRKLFEYQFLSNDRTHYVTQKYQKIGGFIPVNSVQQQHKSFFARMENLEERQNGFSKYDTIQVTGRVSLLEPNSQNLSKSTVARDTWLVAICKKVEAHVSCENSALMSPVIRPDEFVSQHGLDAKLWYQDQRVSIILGHFPSETVGNSVYDLICKADLKCVAVSHMKIMTDGETPSTIFRLIDVRNQFVYVESRSVIVKDAWTKKPMFIISVNRVLDKSEGEQKLQDQAVRYSALLAATRGLTLQDDIVEGSDHTPGIDQSDLSVCDSTYSSVHPSPLSVSTDVGHIDTEHSAFSDNASESVSSQSHDLEELAELKSSQTPLLKSLLTQRNSDTPTVDDIHMESNNGGTGDKSSTHDMESSGKRESVLHSLLFESDSDESWGSPGNHSSDHPAIEKKHFQSEISRFFSVRSVSHRTHDTSYCSDGDDKLQEGERIRQHTKRDRQSDTDESKGDPQHTKNRKTGNLYTSQVSASIVGSIGVKTYQYSPTPAEADSSHLSHRLSETENQVLTSTSDSLDTPGKLHSDLNRNHDHITSQNDEGRKLSHVTLALHKQLEQKHHILHHDMTRQEREISHLELGLASAKTATEKCPAVIDKLSYLKRSLQDQREVLCQLQREAQGRYQKFVLTHRSSGSGEYDSTYHHVPSHALPHSSFNVTE